MLNIVLVGINAKYIHSNPAIHYLKEYAGKEYRLEMELEDAKLNGYTACLVCRGGENE